MKGGPGDRPLFALPPTTRAGNRGKKGGKGSDARRIPGKGRGVDDDRTPRRPLCGHHGPRYDGKFHRDGRGRGDMVGDGESGGTRALRAWATEAAERGARLIGRGEDGHPVSAEEFEDPVAELSQLRNLLDHDRPMLGKVTLVLGGLLAMRHATGQGAPDDPEQVRRLLDEVRDRTTAAGERMAEDDRQWAALFLMLAAAPAGSHRPVGSPQDIWPIVDRAMAAAPDQASAEAARIAGLAAEIQRMPVPARTPGAVGAHAGPAVAPVRERLLRPRGGAGHAASRPSVR